MIGMVRANVSHVGRKCIGRIGNWIMSKRILIVDDDSSVRESLQKILTDAGYGVSAAPDGDAAEAEFGKADLLVLDLNLPIQDGWDVLGRVNSEFPLLPVIVITGLADQLDERTIPGASAFLEKPIEVSQLLETIEHLLSQPPEERIGESRQSSEPWRLPIAGARPKTGTRKVRSES
jgi:DNA-binding NtrC family response regulator